MTLNHIVFAFVRLVDLADSVSPLDDLIPHAFAKRRYSRCWEFRIAELDCSTLEMYQRLSEMNVIWLTLL